MNHMDFWIAIEKFAAAHGMTCSGLARYCGLDATILNKSKRFSATGQPRWLSMGTLARILDATHTSIEDFIKFMPNRKRK